MSLYTLRVSSPREEDGDLIWYFDVEEEFEAARKLANELGILVEDNRDDPDMISDAYEFKNWAETRGLLKDELEEALLEYIACETEVVDSKEANDATYKRAQAAIAACNLAIAKLEPLLRHKSKVVGNFVYTTSHDGYGRIVINKLEQA